MLTKSASTEQDKWTKPKSKTFPAAQHWRIFQLSSTAKRNESNRDVTLLKFVWECSCISYQKLLHCNLPDFSEIKCIPSFAMHSPKQTLFTSMILIVQLSNNEQIKKINTTQQLVVGQAGYQNWTVRQQNVVPTFNWRSSCCKQNDKCSCCQHLTGNSHSARIKRHSV